MCAADLKIFVAHISFLKASEKLDMVHALILGSGNMKQGDYRRAMKAVEKTASTLPAIDAKEPKEPKLTGGNAMLEALANSPQKSDEELEFLSSTL